MYIPGFSEPGFYAGFSEKAHQTQIKQSCPCLPILPNKNDKSEEVSFLPILYTQQGPTICVRPHSYPDLFSKSHISFWSESTM